jgi:hypothetical protein
MRNIPHGHHGTVYYTPSFRPPRRAMNRSKDLPVDLPMFLTRPVSPVSTRLSNAARASLPVRARMTFSYKHGQRPMLGAKPTCVPRYHVMARLLSYTRYHIGIRGTLPHSWTVIFAERLFFR